MRPTACCGPGLFVPVSQFTQLTGQAQITPSLIPAKRGEVPESHLFVLMPESGRFQAYLQGYRNDSFGAGTRC